MKLYCSYSYVPFVGYCVALLVNNSSLKTLNSLRSSERYIFIVCKSISNYVFGAINLATFVILAVRVLAIFVSDSGASTIDVLLVPR